MSKTIWYKTLWHALFLCIEGIAAFSLISGIAVGVLVWRLCSGPVDIGFAREYVEDFLRPSDGGYVKFESVVLHWPDLNGPLLLGIKGGSVHNSDNDLVFSVDEVALSFAKDRLLHGEISPEALVLKKPSVRLLRDKEGRFSVNYETGVKASGQKQTNTLEKLLSYIARPEEQENDSFGTFKMLSIEDARVTFIDSLREKKWEFPDVDADFQSAAVGIRARASASMVSDEQAHIELRALYNWDTKEADLEADFQNFDLAILAGEIEGLDFLRQQKARVDVTASAAVSSDFAIKNGKVQVLSKEGLIKHDYLSQESIAYKDFMLQASYGEETGGITLEKANITLGDVTFAAEAELKTDMLSILQGHVHLGIDTLKQSSISPLWPQGLEERNLEEWVLKKLQDGIFSNVFVDGNIKLIKGEDDQWSYNFSDTKAGFDFENMTINYKWGMTPVTQAKGQGRFDIDKEYLEVEVTGGKLMDIDIPNADLKFYDLLKKGAGIADLSIALKGPLSTTLKYVTEEPVSVQHGINAEQSKGRVDLLLKLDFPTLADVKKSQFKIALSGTMNNLTLPDVVKGMSLTGEQYNVQVKDGLFSLEGSGAIGGRGAEIKYEEFLSSAGKPYVYKVSAALTADKNLRDKMGIELDDFLQGSIPVQVVYIKKSKSAAEADVKVDLTPAHLYLEPFGYDKKPGLSARGSLKALLDNGNVQQIQNIKISGPKLIVSNAQLKFAQINGEAEVSYGLFKNILVNETKANLEIQNKPSEKLKIIIKGETIDLRPFMDAEEDKNKEHEDPPLLLSAAAREMLTTGNEKIYNAKLYADIDAKGRYNQLEMDGEAGNGDVYLRYKPDKDGKRTFRLEADDAGSALKAFGVYDKIKGGKLVIYGEPIHGIYDRNLIGVAEISNFKVVKAPGLAKLLGAMSLPGILDVLGNEGITFTKLEAGFDWLYKPKGSMLVLKDGRTSGNSLGLTFDGTFDNEAQTVDVSGTLVPLSGINEALSNIPIIGQILSGGSSSIFAATYEMKGDAKDPKVSVNPLSVLTPGILRRILFEKND